MSDFVKRYPCRDCGCTERSIVVMESGPHYGKSVCSWCGRFCSWVPRPPVKLEDMELPIGPEHDSEVLPLIGTEGQVKWAGSIRPSMLKKSAMFLPPNVLCAIRTIQDATWWIANRDVQNTDNIRWPKSWAMKAGSSK